jgi:hypothetical protein
VEFIDRKVNTEEKCEIKRGIMLGDISYQGKSSGSSE